MKSDLVGTNRTLSFLRTSGIYQLGTLCKSVQKLLQTNQVGTDDIQSLLLQSGFHSNMVHKMVFLFLVQTSLEHTSCISFDQ
jgi:hypothetical protein